jgi:tetratricopeptide (TPR) repeat protein
MTQLAMLDFRVREMIFDCFAELSQAVSDHGEGSFFREVSLQLAFCYKVGFGTSVNEQRCLEWITKSGRASELNLYLGNLAAQDQTYAYRRTLYHASVGEGHILPSTNPAYYLEHSLTKRLLEIQRREIQDWKSVLGRSHWLVQSTINNHIFTLQQFGRYVEAEEIARENMAALIPALGKQNAHSLRAHWVLAAACVYEGKFDEAHDLAERALAISLRTVADLGARDADLLDCLGLIYAVRGKLRLAVKVRQQALSKAREAFGDVHETTIAIMWNLRETLLEQNDYISTRKLDEQIIPILRQYFGSGHQVTLRAEVGHAELRWQMRKWGAGRFGPRLLRDIDTELFDRAKASLGESHPVTLLAMGSIAVAHQSRFKYDEAIALLTGIVDISAKNTGIHSYETRTWADLLRKFREHRKIAVLSSRMTSLRMGRWIISLGHKNVWAMQDAQHIWGPVYRSETLPDYELPDWICGTKTMILQKVPWLRGWSSPQSASVVASPVVEFARAENLTSEVDNPKLNKENTSSHASDGAYYWVQQMNPLLLRDPFDMETQQTRRHTNT